MPNRQRSIGARCLGIAILATFAATPLAAQPDTLPAGGFAIEIEMRDRWLHGRQQSAFTAFGSDHRWVLVDSLPPPGADGRSLSLRYEAFGALDAAARLRLSATGRVVRSEIDWPAPPIATFQSSADSLRLARMILFAGGYVDGRLSLPEERTWELFPTFPSGAPRAGRQWTDTLLLSAERGGYRQSLTGVRVSTIVGDTTVGSRRTWIVRDSALLRFEERRPDHEDTPGPPATVLRDVRGVVRGRHLYDPLLGAFLLRSDTARLTGEATLRFDDGRSFGTPAVYERTRRWTLHHAAGYAARRADLRRERDSSYGGMVQTPSNDLESRLGEGDSALLDSLVSAWRSSADPNQRDDLVQLLRFWGRMDAGAWADFLRFRLAAGDSTNVLRELALQPFSSRESVDLEMLQTVLPFIRDPGLAFSFGLDRDPFYASLRESLVTRPPAATPDTAEWACTPAACALLARQWEEASEPRLRDLGLIARVVLDPARWSDTLLARAAVDTSFLGHALQLVRGVDPTQVAGPGASFPAPGAGWRAWRQWMSAQDPTYVAPPGTPSPQGARWDRGHETALRFHIARTGRDVVGELRRAFAGASSDTARLVFGTMLLGLREHRPVSQDVANRILHGSEADFSLGAREMFRLLGEPTAPDPRARNALTDQLLRAVLTGENPWPPAAAFVRVPDFEPILHGGSPPPVFLVADSLPAELRALWSGRIQLISSAEMPSRSNRLAGLYFVPGRILRAGPFAVVSMEYLERHASASGAAPIGYAGGLTAHLIETPDGWRLVSFQRWVT